MCCIACRYDVQRLFNGTASYVIESEISLLKESLDIFTRDNSSLNSFNNKMFTYTMLSWDANTWKPILSVVEETDQLSIQEFVRNGFADNFLFDNMCQDPTGCPREEFGSIITSELNVSIGNLKRAPILCGLEHFWVSLLQVKLLKVSFLYYWLQNVLNRSVSFLWYFRLLKMCFECFRQL